MTALTVVDGSVRICSRRWRAVEPVVDGDTVTSVQLVSRGGGVETALQAQVVFDATGRSAHAVQYLNRLGFDTPPEDQIPSTGGYSSQLLSIPAGPIAERMAVINNGSSKPGALLVAYEHDTWMLAIARQPNMEAHQPISQRCWPRPRSCFPRQSCPVCGTRHP